MMSSAAAALDGVAAATAEQDVALAPDGPLSGQTPEAEVADHVGCAGHRSTAGTSAASP